MRGDSADAGAERLQHEQRQQCAGDVQDHVAERDRAAGVDVAQQRELLLHEHDHVNEGRVDADPAEGMRRQHLLELEMMAGGGIRGRFCKQGAADEHQRQDPAHDFRVEVIGLDAGETQRHRVRIVDEKSPQRLDAQREFPQRALLARSRLLLDDEVLRLLDEQRRQHREQQHDQCAGIDEHVVVEDRGDGVAGDTDGPRDGLHPGEAACTLVPLRRYVGDDGAGRVETDVHREVERQRDDERDTHDRLDAQRRRDDADLRQCEQRQRRDHTADQDERAPAAVPEPHLVGDEADDDLAEDAGQRARRPDEADVVDVESVLRGQDPAQRGQLGNQREPHRR